MKRDFVKMHGIGNDYIYFDCLDEPLPEPEALARKLSDRHFSVGGDGIVLILPSDSADAEMKMFNADGSEGKMCGNALRCVGKFLYDVKGLRKDCYRIATQSGIKTLRLVSTRSNGEARSFCADMGSPVLEPARIPARYAGEKIVDVPLTAAGKTWRATCLSMGNPHCVVFVADPDALDLEKIGSVFERHSMFPERVNTEFVRVLGRNRLRMRVFERGSGETLACGTGACAAAVAAVLNGYAEQNAKIEILLKGGALQIVYTGETVLMTGPAEISFFGMVDI